MISSDPLIVAIVDDLEQITALVGGEWFGSPVVDDNDGIGALQRGHQARKTTFAAAPGRGRQRGATLVYRGRRKPSRQALLPRAQANQDFPVPVGPRTMAKWLQSRTTHWQVASVLKRDRSRPRGTYGKSMFSDGGRLTELGGGQSA